MDCSGRNSCGCSTENCVLSLMLSGWWQMHGQLSNHRAALGRHLVKVFAILAGVALANAESGPEESRRPVEGIMDNSFLIEEAYNQEAGVVQHIFNGLYSFNRFTGVGEKRADLSFTQEWPVYGQTHQFSYTIPYGAVREAGHWT